MAIDPSKVALGSTSLAHAAVETLQRELAAGDLAALARDEWSEAKAFLEREMPRAFGAGAQGQAKLAEALAAVAEAHRKRWGPLGLGAGQG